MAPSWAVDRICLPSGLKMAVDTGPIGSPHAISLDRFSPAIRPLPEVLHDARGEKSVHVAGGAPAVPPVKSNCFIHEFPVVSKPNKSRKSTAGGDCPAVPALDMKAASVAFGIGIVHFRSLESCVRESSS